MYTHRKFWFPKRPFWARKKLYGNQTSRGILVEGECIHIGNFDSQNGHFEPKSSFTGIKNSKGILVEGECKHIEGLIQVWFPKRPFRAKKQLYGNQISRGMVEGECKHIEGLIPKTAILSQKAALRESIFQRYGRRRMYTYRRFRWI